MSHTTQTICFAGGGVAVDCHDADSARIASHLYRHLARDRIAPVRVRLQLRRAANPAEYVLFCEEKLIYRGPSRGMAAALLLERSLHYLAHQCRGGLLLHAACVARRGSAVVLPGVAGAGKTTLTAWLVTRRFDYLTDELVFLREETMRVEAFRRPLHVKRRARAVLAPWVDFDAPDSVMRTPDGFLVSPTLLNPAAAPAAAEASLLLFPRYEEGAGLDLRPISPARAGLLLLAALVNARALPRHGFGQTSQLARDLPAYVLTYGAVDQIGDRIEALLDRRS